MGCRDALWADSGTSGLLQPTPSEGRQRWHYDTLSSPHLPQDPATTHDNYGQDGAAGAWATPQHQQGTVYVTTGRLKQRTPLPNPPGQQDLPTSIGRQGAVGRRSRLRRGHSTF